MLQGLLNRIEHWLFAGDRTRWWTPSLRYPYALLHDLFRGELTLRAMGLVYTTLLSIVPLLALLFSIFKSVGAHRQLRPLLLQFLEPLGERADEIADRVMLFIDRIQGGVLGSLGLAFLLYTSISMIQKIEESFNFIWRVEEPRGWGRRISEYLSALILGPILLFATLGLLTAFSSSKAAQFISAIQPFGALIAGLGKATPYILIVAVFAFLYAFVPNAKVRLRAALIAGAAAGVIWTLSGLAFASFVAHAGGTMLIYAGFAFLILGLIWLYLSWLVLLLGAQLAFYIQHPHYLRPGSGVLQLSASLTERLALSVMYLIARSFAHGAAKNGNRWTANELAEHFNVAGAAIEPMMQKLEAAGLLIAAEDERLLPGRDLAQISLADVVDAVRNDHGSHKVAHIRSIEAADRLAQEAAQAMRARLQDLTLKDWIETRSAD